MQHQECLSNYELSIVLRSLLAADGTLLHCPAKSKLMGILEKISGSETSDHFIAFIQRKYEYDELRVVFDRYDIPKSH